MPAGLRIEIFPSELQRSLDFYIQVLQFKLIKLEGTYAYIGRDNIFIGMIEVATEDSLAARTAYRRPTKGIEIVLEVDDLETERNRVLQHGFKLEDDIKVQEWGLKDFRMIDPDGYYLRITTHTPGKDGKGVLKA